MNPVHCTAPWCIGIGMSCMSRSWMGWKGLNMCGSKDATKYFCAFAGSLLFWARICGNKYPNMLLTILSVLSSMYIGMETLSCSTSRMSSNPPIASKCSCVITNLWMISILCWGNIFSAASLKLFDASTKTLYCSGGPNGLSTE